MSEEKWFKELVVRKYLVLLVGCLLLLVSMQGTSVVADQTRVTVREVVDGDTLRLDSGELVRLIGIDSPEKRENPRAQMQAKRSQSDLKNILELGRRSSLFLESKVKKGSQVSLEFDVERRDRYGRLLAYASLVDGTQINELMLRMGYAKLLTVAPNVKYEKRLQRAFQEGRSAKRGLWAFEGFAK